MRPLRARRLLPILAAPLIALILTGCAARGNAVESDARRALDDAGIRGGAEAFDTGSGLSGRYNLLVCAVGSADSEPAFRAQLLADVANALHPIVEFHQEVVHGIRVRVVDEGADPSDEDLDNWCRPLDDRILPLDDLDLWLSAGSVRDDFADTYELGTLWRENVTVTPPEEEDGA